MIDVFILTNGRMTVIETINSLQNQSFSAFNAIISDNSNSHFIRDYVCKLKDARFSYIGHETGRSGADNIDYCLTQVKSKYFVLMHDDDLFAPSYLSKMLERFENNPSVQWGVCNSYLFSEAIDGKLQRANANTLISGVYQSGEKLFEDLLYVKPLIIMPAVFYRYDIIDSLKFDHKFSALGDLKMWLTLSLSHNFVYEAEPLFYYRKHFNNHSNECAIDGTFFVQAIWLINWLTELKLKGEIKNFSVTKATSKIINAHLVIFIWGVIRTSTYQLSDERYNYICNNIGWLPKLLLFLFKLPLVRMCVSKPIILLKKSKDKFLSIKDIVLDEGITRN